VPGAILAGRLGLGSAGEPAAGAMPAGPAPGS
jgi:hypothetical protein